MSSDPQHIEVSFELVLSDMLAAHRFLLLRSKSGRLVPVVYGVLLLSAIGRGSGSLIVAVVLGTAVMGAWLLYWQPRRAFLASPNQRGRQRWVLGPDGLSCEVTAADGARLGGSDMDWRSVVRARESSQAFLLSSSPRVSFVLPKRALEPSQVTEVRALLDANVAG